MSAAPTDDAGAEAAEDASGRVCEPGALVACSCDDGRQGKHRCAHDGSQWRACVCADAGVDATDGEQEADMDAADDAQDDVADTGAVDAGSDAPDAKPYYCDGGRFYVVPGGYKDGVAPCPDVGTVGDTLTKIKWTRVPVCTANDGGDWQLTYAEALSICAAMGARLPTQKDITRVTTSKDTCAFPFAINSWTSESCDGGMVFYSSPSGVCAPKDAERTAYCVKP